MFSRSFSLFSYKNFKNLNNSQIKAFKKYVETKYRIKVVNKYKIYRVNSLTNSHPVSSQTGSDLSKTCKQREEDESALSHIMKRYRE